MYVYRNLSISQMKSPLMDISVYILSTHKCVYDYSVKVENKQNRPAHFPKATEHALGEAEGALRVPGGGPGYTGAGCGSLTRHRAVFQL